MTQALSSQQKAVARLHNLLLPARKVRLIVDLVRGMSVNEAETHLVFLPHHAAQAVLKLLRSAAKNGEGKGMDPKDLFISQILVSDGPISKRWTPRARGSASPLYKRSSHITIELAPVGERKLKRLTGITIKREAPEVRKFKELEAGGEPQAKPLDGETRETEAVKEDSRKPLIRARQKKGDIRIQKRGFLPKIFRRKSV